MKKNLTLEEYARMAAHLSPANEGDVIKFLSDLGMHAAKIEAALDVILARMRALNSDIAAKAA